MAATLMLVSVTPFTPVIGTFLWRSAPDTSVTVVAPAPPVLAVVVDVALLEPAFPQATANSPSTTHVTRIRERIGSPRGFEPAMCGVPDRNP